MAWASILPPKISRIALSIPKMKYNARCILRFILVLSQTSADDTDVNPRCIITPNYYGVSGFFESSHQAP